jgi:hypothetical protein
MLQDYKSVKEMLTVDVVYLTRSEHLEDLI